MKNKVLDARLDGLLNSLRVHYESGSESASANKGIEREAFIEAVLKNAIPPVYRISSGEAVDRHGNQSGQLDIVIEYPFFPRLSVPMGTQAHLAESVAAVIEVKSDASQWKEVVQTHAKLRKLTRNVRSIASDKPYIADKPYEILESSDEYEIQTDPTMGPMSYSRIPMFAVGYRGFAKLETIERKVIEERLAGLLVVDQRLYFGYQRGRVIKAVGNCSLWALIFAITDSARGAESNHV